MSIREEDVRLIQHLTSRPRRGGRVRIVLRETAAALGLDELRVLMGLIRLQSLGLISVVGVPEFSEAKDQMVQAIRLLDYSFMSGKVAEYEYEIVRRTMSELVLSMPNSTLEEVPPSPSLMGVLLRRRSLLVSSLINYLGSRDRNPAVMEDLLRALREVEESIVRLEGSKGLGSEALETLSKVREKLEEDLLRASIGDLPHERLVETASWSSEVVEEVLESLAKQFLNGEDFEEIPPELKAEFELLKARLVIGEVSQEEYDFLYQELTRRAAESRRRPRADVEVLERSVEKLREQLEAMRSLLRVGTDLNLQFMHNSIERLQRTLKILEGATEEVKRIQFLVNHVQA
ncbi:MAG: hypothetical protein NZ988_04225 [Thaumarchaeota archaeon]|nr:hypothetical protein [Candidatus Calditenuaceae archaeon]MDW8187234.1 hypothetical protein [Nitrososphaerota archaeon]